VRQVFSPTGAAGATAGQGGVGIWDWRRPRELVHLRDPTSLTGDAAFSPNGRLLATTGFDRAVRIWSWRERRQVAVMRAGTRRSPDYQPGALDFHANGDLVAAADGETVRIWDWRHRREAARLPAGKLIDDVALSPDGRLVAVARADGVTQIWDWRAHEVLAELRGRGRAVATNFGPDGRLVVTAEEDGGVRVWDWGAEQPVAEFRGAHPRGSRFDPGTQDAAFSRNGRLVASVGGDSRAHVYRCEVCAPLKELRALARRRAIRRYTAAERRRYLHDAG
jgi:WD40 repeat protein